MDNRKSADVVKLREELESLPMPPDGGGSGGGGDMLGARVDRLESDMRDVRDRLARIEVRLDWFQSTFALKDDLHKEMNLQTWRIIGAMVAIAGLAVAISRYVAG